MSDGTLGATGIAVAFFIASRGRIAVSIGTRESGGAGMVSGISAGRRVGSESGARLLGGGLLLMKLTALVTTKS